MRQAAIGSLSAANAARTAARAVEEECSAAPVCPMSACMSLLGGVWTTEIIWNLSEGPRRFSELRRAKPAILGQGAERAAAGPQERSVLSRTVLATTPPSVEYALTGPR